LELTLSDKIDSGLVKIAQRCAPLKLWTGGLVSWIQETYGNYSKPIVVEGSRGPLTKVTSECACARRRSLAEGRQEAQQRELRTQVRERTLNSLASTVHSTGPDSLRFPMQADR
jgi:hypothetical protein